MYTFRLKISSSLLLMAFLLIPSLGSAETRYVTDQFEITMRSGASTSNSIVSMLKSGQSLKVIEQDEATRYTLVETSSGRQGYVLSRYLDDQPSGRDRYIQLKNRSEQLEAKISQLNTELTNFKSEKKDHIAEISTLTKTLKETQTELNDLTESTRDTLRVVKQNESLKARINELDKDKQLLSEENAKYKDSTAMDWFIRGAGVSLLAFLIGIIVTKIRWKKRDSWSNY